MHSGNESTNNNRYGSGGNDPVVELRKPLDLGDDALWEAELGWQKEESAAQNRNGTELSPQDSIEIVFEEEAVNIPKPLVEAQAPIHQSPPPHSVPNAQAVQPEAHVVNDPLALVRGASSESNQKVTHANTSSAEKLNSDNERSDSFSLSTAKSAALATTPLPTRPEDDNPNDPAAASLSVTTPDSQLTLLEAKAALAVERYRRENIATNGAALLEGRAEPGSCVPERHPLDQDLETSIRLAPPCITNAELVLVSADEEERARIIREAQLAIAAETARAEPVESLPQDSNLSMRSRNHYLWRGLVIVAIVLVVIGVSFGIVQGRSTSQVGANPMAATKLPVNGTTVTMTISPTASPTAVTADGKRAFTSRAELWTAVDGYLAWRENEGDTELPETVARYGFPIGTWDVSRVTDFARVFDPDRDHVMDSGRNPSKRSPFDEDLSGWDLSNAITVRGMFAAASAFTGMGLETWNVAKVLDFSFMLAHAYKFVGNVSSWNTTSATNLEAMFLYAADFNGDVTGWDVSKAESTAFMFRGAESFVGGDMRDWNVAKVKSMQRMFTGAKVFTGMVSTWNTARVTNMDGMVRSGHRQWP
jgi:Mycoplasma protein of unknown function, DUF285